MSSAYPTGVATKSPASPYADDKKPRKAPTTEKKLYGDRKYRKRIEEAIGRLSSDSYERMISDLHDENKRLREENDMLRNVNTAYKRELEEFRAEFNEYRYKCLGLDEGQFGQDVPMQTDNAEEN